jgi:glycosyltransferase involved in cell wall biosynthesis
VELSSDRYFRAGDINALSEKINGFIGKKLSAEEKKIQLRIIDKKYNWEKIANMTLNVYERDK